MWCFCLYIYSFTHINRQVLVTCQGWISPCCFAGLLYNVAVEIIEFIFQFQFLFIIRTPTIFNGILFARVEHFCNFFTARIRTDLTQLKFIYIFQPIISCNFYPLLCQLNKFSERFCILGTPDLITVEIFQLISQDTTNVTWL